MKIMEVKDYEYFYEEEDEEEKNDNKVDEDYEKLNLIRENFIKQYKDINSSAFLGIASGESTNKKIDYAIKYINLFKSFINSVESSNLTHYRTFLCIMVKLLLYDGEHIQALFKDLIYDKYFFKNLNRELNYHIVQCINSSKKYELFYGCVKITDITNSHYKLNVVDFNNNSTNFMCPGCGKILVLQKQQANNIICCSSPMCPGCGRFLMQSC